MLRPDAKSLVTDKSGEPPQRAASFQAGMKNSKSNSKKRVGDVASAHPSAIDVAASTKTAGDKLRRLGAKKFPVAREDRLVGRIDDPNPDRSAARFGHDPESTTIGEMGLGRAIYCYEDQSPDEARKIMTEHGVEHMPVVDRDLRIVGMVALQSLEPVVPGNPRRGTKRKAA